MTVGELMDRLSLYNRDIEVQILAAMDYNGVEDVFVEDAKDGDDLPIMVVVSEG